MLGAEGGGAGTHAIFFVHTRSTKLQIFQGTFCKTDLRGVHYALRCPCNTGILGGNTDVRSGPQLGTPHDLEKCIIPNSDLQNRCECRDLEGGGYRGTLWCMFISHYPTPHTPGHNHHNSSLHILPHFLYRQANFYSCNLTGGGGTRLKMAMRVHLGVEWRCYTPFLPTDVF